MYDFFKELEDNNIRLNNQQREAVSHTDGPCLVLAVPGGGKTTVLLSRIGYLTKVCGVPSERILSITFSNASADDMKQRVQERFSDFNIESEFMTIHSLSNKIVKDYDRIHRIRRNLIEVESGFPFTKKSIIKKIYLKHNLDDINDERLDEVISAIGLVHNMMISPSELSHLKIPNFSLIFEDYENIKKEQDLIDYDGMLTEAYNILKTDPLILNKYRTRYDYIQVDEAQDNSLIQHEIIKLMAEPNNNIFYVSDDDQSIYGFRGAFPEFLLGIDKIYTNTKRYFMEQNYRSTPQIVDAANQFIKRNKVRYEKNIFTQNNSGNKIDFISVRDGDAQISDLLKRLEKCEKYSEVAILYRTNISSIAIANSLMNHGIPFKIQGFNNYFFKHWIVEDVKRFLEIALNPNDADKLEKIFKKMKAKITGVMIQYAKSNPVTGNIFEDMLKNPNLDQSDLDEILKLKSKFETLAQKVPENAVTYIENGFYYMDYVTYIAEQSGFSLEGMKKIFANIKNIARTNNSIQGLLSQLEVLEEEMEASVSNYEGVTLSTIHSSKGLEWDDVFMVDLINGSFPSYQTLDRYKEGTERFLEEERRLFYVAMTRAKKNLHLYRTLNINQQPVEQSVFLTEIDEILFPNKVSNLFSGIGSQNTVAATVKPKTPSKRIKRSPSIVDTKGYDVGVKVKHVTFGVGLVRENDGAIVKIAFSKGLKGLNLDMCVENGLLEIL